jgi:hypothetical protein
MSTGTEFYMPSFGIKGLMIGLSFFWIETGWTCSSKGSKGCSLGIPIGDILDAKLLSLSAELLKS